MAKVLQPGFRFHPTDVELVSYYLKRKILGKSFKFEAVAEIELYKFSPWDLPEKSFVRNNDLQWYFFCHRDTKYLNGSRINRATGNGYWKTTGKDRPIVYNTRTVGKKKTLVFYLGRAPHGTRTDWVMHEYKLEDKEWPYTEFSQDAYVLCKIMQKSGLGPKNGEQYGAPFREEDWEDDTDIKNALPFPCTHSSDSTSEDNRAVKLEPLEQSVAFKVGESSSKPQLLQDVEPTTLQLLSEIREPQRTQDVAPSSLQVVSKVSERSPITGLRLADEIFRDQLKELLNSSPPC